MCLLRQLCPIRSTTKYRHSSCEPARSVCEVLTGILPTLTPSWWNDLVLQNLSFQQQRAVEVRKVSALSGLDLAALLRIFDANWNAIAERLRLPNEVRHYLKEARTVRDRWAHASSTEYGPDDALPRPRHRFSGFSQPSGRDNGVTEEIKRLKDHTIALRDMAATPKPAALPSAAIFTVGQLVALLSPNPKTTGAVIAIQETGPERQYSVFQEDGAIVTYYEAQLSPTAVADELRTIRVDEFKAHLSALQIRHPSTSVVYSLNAARIDSFLISSAPFSSSSKRNARGSSSRTA